MVCLLVILKLIVGSGRGNPLSSILFVVAMEVLLINIREDLNIEGIQIDQNNWTKLSCYADDLTCFIKDANSANKIFPNSK